MRFVTTALILTLFSLASCSSRIPADRRQQRAPRSFAELQAYQPTPLPALMEETTLLTAAVLEELPVPFAREPFSAALFLKDGGLILAHPDGLLARFDQGRLTRIYTHRGQGPGDLLRPYSLCQDGMGQVRVMDAEKFALIRFAPDLTYLDEHLLKLDNPPFTLTPLPDQTFLFNANHQGHALLRLDGEGRVRFPGPGEAGHLPPCNLQRDSFHFVAGATVFGPGTLYGKELNLQVVPWDTQTPSRTLRVPNPGREKRVDDPCEIGGRDVAFLGHVANLGGTWLLGLPLADYDRYHPTQTRRYTSNHYYLLNGEGQHLAHWVRTDELIETQSPQGPNSRAVFVGETGDLKEWCLKARVGKP